MYQVLLTRRYLFSKVMPLLASLGVMLCSAVVLVTWSVMGGFLVMLINTGRTMAGDVVVRWPGTGIPHYEDLIKRLEAEASVEAAAPVIEAFGMISPPDGSTEGVVIRGVDERFAKVTRYSEIIWWRKPEAALPKDTERRDPRLGEISGTTWDELYEQGLKLQRRDPRTGEVRPAVVPVDCSTMPALALGGLLLAPGDGAAGLGRDARRDQSVHAPGRERDDHGAAPGQQGAAPGAV